MDPIIIPPSNDIIEVSHLNPISEQDLAKVSQISSLANQVIPIPQSDQVIQVIFHHCIQRNVSQHDSICLRISRIGLKVIAFGCGIGGAIPNISVALKFGGKNVPLGISVACANFITRTFLVTWSYHNIIDREIGLNGKIKRQISHNKLNVAKRVAIKVSVFITALIAQTPRAYLAYAYNNNNIAYPILTYLSLVAIPAYSLDLSLTTALELRNSSQFERLLNEIKGDLKKKIRNCRDKLKNLSQTDRQDIVTDLNISANQSADAAVTDFISRVCREGNLAPRVHTTCQKIKSVASRSLNILTSVTTVAAQTGFYFWVGVQGAKAVWDNPFFSYSAGTIISLVNFYLTSKAMFSHSQKLFNQAFFRPLQLLTGDSVSSVIMPKTRGAVGLATIGISALSTGTMVQAVNDYFTGELQAILKVFVPLSMFILGHLAINEIVDDIFELIISLSKSSPESDKNLIKLDHTLKLFHFMIDKMSHKNFAKLLLSLPNDEFENLVNDRITHDLVWSYVNPIAV